MCRRWRRWTECFCHGEADGDTLELLTTLLFKDYFEMRRLRDIEEVLWILAPKLVFLSLFVDPAATCSVCIPLTLKLLLNCGLKLSELDLLFRREDTKIERPLTLLLICNLCIRDDHVVHRLLLVLRC